MVSRRLNCSCPPAAEGRRSITIRKDQQGDADILRRTPPKVKPPRKAKIKA